MPDKKKLLKNLHFYIKNEAKFSKKYSDLVYNFIKKRINFFDGKIINDLKNFDIKEKVIVYVDLNNPFLDFNLITEATNHLSKKNLYRVLLKDFTPGTVPIYIEKFKNKEKRVENLVSFSNKRKNVNFDLKKNKRLKCFLYLLNKYKKNLHKISVNKLLELIKKEHSHLAGYCTGAKLITNKRCPYCNSTDYDPIYSDASVVMIGYISPEIPLYNFCKKCNLGFLAREMPANKIYMMYDDFDFLDNPSIPNIDNSFLSIKEKRALKLVELKLKIKPRCLDLGGGSGKFSLACKKAYPNWKLIHSDFDQRQNLNHKDAKIESKVINFLKDKIGEKEYDLITAFEVVEHIPIIKMKNFFKNVYDSLKPGGFFLFTTPNFDFPLIKSFDFYVTYAPHHYSIFSESWLKKYISKNTDFLISKIDYGSDLIDAGFLEYNMDNNNTFQSRSSAKVLHSLLEKNKVNYNLLLDKGFGSEVIFLLKKND